MAKKSNKKKENKNKKESESGESPKLEDYKKLIEKLKEEREALQEEVSRDYREARRYVRSHPEEGVLIGFLGGVALGFLLGKLTK